MCKICGSLTKNITINKIKYEFCESCGFLAKTEEFVLLPKDEYERYLYHNNSDNEGYVKYQENFFNEIRDFLGQKVLDYGCGANHILADILFKNNYNPMYYDLYFYPNEDYEKHHYDAIILEEVIEHLNQPMDVLSKLISLLNENGKLIIRTNLIPENVFVGKWWYLRDATHISFFDIKTFEIICNLLPISIIYCNDKDLIIFEKEWFFDITYC